MTDEYISRLDALDLFGHGSTYTSEEAQRMIKNLPSVTSWRFKDWKNHESVERQSREDKSDERL